MQKTSVFNLFQECVEAIRQGERPFVNLREVLYNTKRVARWESSSQRPLRLWIAA